MAKLSSQLLKGTLEGAMLAVLATQEAYAYEIHQRLRRQGFGAIAEGTLYPLLLKMERTGLLAGERRPSPNGGPARKYYHLTPDGHAALDEFSDQWRQLTAAMAPLLKEATHE